MSTYIVRPLALLLGIVSIGASFAYTGADCAVVQDLANRGFVSYQNNCRDYNLDKFISRQEVAAVALKVAESCGVVQNTPPVGDFYCSNMYRDVSNNTPNTWACRAIETLANANVVSRNNSYFRPLSNITRAEALVIILDSAGLPAQSATYDDWRFTNSDAVNWQKPIIQYAYDNGMIDVIGSFRANRHAYRSEIFNYAQKALNKCTNGNTYNYNNNYNNNYSNTTCSTGQYSSGGSCYSCTGAPWNGRYTTRGTCDWTCNSGYYRSGNECIANNNNYNTYGAGQCNNALVNSCITGYASGYYTSGNYAYWTCTGSNGSAASCSMYNYNNNNTYGSNGQCGTTVNSCIVGSFRDTVDSGNYAYWNCTGTNGLAVSCSAYNNYNYGTTAQCGSTVNSCISGTFWDTVDSGNYAYWNCNGSNGTAVSCSAWKNTNYSGQCGVGYRWINNGCSSCNTKPNNSRYIYADSCEYECYAGYTRDSAGFCVQNNNSWNNAQCGSTVNSCISGTFWDTVDSGNYAYWNCMGSNGTTISCSAYNNYNYGTTAQCGSTVNSCISGTFWDTVDSGNYAYWNCTGSNGTSVSCSAYNSYNYGYSIHGQCGSTTNSCISGTFSDVVDTPGYRNWYCKGTNGGNDQFCGIQSGTSYNNNYNTMTPCCDKPKPLYNAYYTNNNGCWSCNQGYRLSSDGYSCVY